MAQPDGIVGYAYKNSENYRICCALLLFPGLRFFPRLPPGNLSIGEVFAAVLAGHVVDLVEHELVVRAAESIQQQAAELTELLRQHRLRRLFESLCEGRVRHGDAV